MMRGIQVKVVSLRPWAAKKKVQRKADLNRGTIEAMPSRAYLTPKSARQGGRVIQESPGASGMMVTEAGAVQLGKRLGSGRV